MKSTGTRRADRRRSARRGVGTILVALATIAAVASAVAAPAASGQGCQESILFVAGSAPAPAGDRSLLAGLEDRAPGGDCVTTVADNDVTVTQAEAYDVVVIASSVHLDRIGGRLRDAAVPILVSEAYLFDDMGLVAQGGARELGDRTTIRVADSGHRLAAGYSGPIGVYASPAPLNYGRRWAIGDQRVARTSNAHYRWSLVAFPAGSQLVDGPAAAARVAFFASYGAVLSPQGHDLLDASIDWLADNPVQLSCGQVVTTDVVLGRDLSHCNGHGLVVGADGITVDLGGHVIDGDHDLSTAGNGIEVRSRRQVTIRNGTIRGFVYGVNLFATVDSEIAATTFDENGHSVEMVGSNRNTIQDTTTAGSLWAAMRMTWSNDNTVADNTTDQGRWGIVVNHSDRNQIRDNEISGGTRGDQRGILVEGGSDENRISGNVVSHFRDVGILAWISPDSPDDAPTSTDIDGNTVTDTGPMVGSGDGIRVEAGVVDTTLTGNRSDNNSGWGILALTPVVDGGGNTASGNGAGQCLGVIC